MTVDHGQDVPSRPPLKHAAIVVIACVLVYWIGLDFRGLADSEGHRVVPGWELLDSGHWAAPTMFGQVYLRKPPGMPWAVAAFAGIFGQSEYSARAVSATAMTLASLVALWMGARWFGRHRGIASGLLAALFPMFVAPGRVAEIESLNNAATLASVLLMIHFIVWPLEFGRRWGTALLAALCIAITGLVKGPAGLVVVVSAVAASCIATGSFRKLKMPAFWMTIVILAAAWAVWYVAAKRSVEASGQTPVVQGVSEFMWTGGAASIGTKIVKVLAMPITALVTAAPASLAIGLPFLASSGDRTVRVARAVSLTVLITLAVLMIGGVGNPRYAQPAMIVLSVLGGFVLAQGSSSTIARRLLLGRVWVWPAILLPACIALGPVRDLLRSPNHSGRNAGYAIAERLPDGAIIWADELIEARPEILMYAERRASQLGKHIHGVWKPGFAAAGKLPPPGGFIALRDDAKSGERDAKLPPDKLERLLGHFANTYSFNVYRVLP